MPDINLKPPATLALWGTVAGPQAAEIPPFREVIKAIDLVLPTAAPAERAQLRYQLGHLALLAGDGRFKAREAFTLMHAEALQLGDLRLEVMALCGLAMVHDFVGERRQSLELAQTAHRKAEQLGDQRLLAHALNAEAQYYKENGENERAATLYRQMEQIGLALNDTRLVMGAHIGLGRTTPMHKPTAGMAHYAQAIEIAKAAGDEVTLATCYNNLSDWKIYVGEYHASIRLRDETLAIAQRLGMRPHMGRALVGQAKAYTLLGDLKKAEELLRKGFPTVVSTGDLEGDLHSELNLAYLYTQNGDVPRAVDMYRQTLERSLAAPDHACAVFAQEALEILAEGDMPAPGVLPDQPARDLTEAELKLVTTARYPYGTGDLVWVAS